MGKTKTAFVSDATDTKSSEEKYREKKEKQAAETGKAEGTERSRSAEGTERSRSAEGTERSRSAEGTERSRSTGGTEQRRKTKAPKEKPEKVHIAGLKGGQRIKMVTSEPLPEEESKRAGEQEKTEGAEQGRGTEGPERAKRVERIRGKKYQEAKKKIKPGEAYALADAIKLVKDTSYSKFDGTFEAHFTLKKAGISANVTLPHSGGRAKKVEVASEETIKKLTAGKIDFDVLLATPEMMPKLVPFARLLGPKGLMPNPKNGTLISDIKRAKDFSANTLNLKTEREAPLMHLSFGKASQKDEELQANLEAILKALGGSKQIVRGYIKSTMSPAVRIAV